MLKTRVIPVILWRGNQCVQTTKFARPPRVFGSLMDAVQIYERRSVDELILLDIGAGHRHAPMFNIVLTYTPTLFCPVTLGGGIRKLEHIEEALRSGADKVSIRRAATPEFLSSAAKRFGSQAIVFSLDIGPLSSLRAAKESAQRAEESGAGEILLTSVACNGTMHGYDLELIHAVASAVTIPVIANGGCGKPEDMLRAIRAGAHAVAASTMFLFTEVTPRECAEYLASQNIPARIR